jgi:aspartate racemase
MKTIGLIGGRSWESLLVYNQLINEMVKEKLGSSHFTKNIIYSVDVDEIKTLQDQGKWDKASKIMIEAARNVERGGAEFLVISTNTMHKEAELIEGSISIPLLHIADAAANEIVKSGVKKVALLGTEVTVQQDFYKERLKDKFGLDVYVPEEEDRNVVHEVCLGKSLTESKQKQKYQTIIDKLIKNGAEAIILGCTEIDHLICAKDCTVPVFDMTRIHVQYAVDYALEDLTIHSK